jgi:hypothetical protein
VTEGVTVLTAGDTGLKVYANRGAGVVAIVLLFSAVVGAMCSFYVDTATPLRVQASDPDTIRVGTSVTDAGGSISSSTVGSWITLVCVYDREWVASSSMGTWTF